MKKLITLLLVLTGMVGTASAITVYFKPDSKWAEASATFGLNMKNGDQTKLVQMTLVDGTTNVYSATYDTSYPNYEFLRYSTDFSTYWSMYSGTMAAPTTDIYFDKSGNNWENTWDESTENIVVLYNDAPKDCYIAGDRFITNYYEYWSGSSANNKMTYNNDFTYTLNVTNNIIPSGSYGYKPVFDGNWIGDNGSANWTLDLSGEGYGNGFYSIEYTYNCLTNTATATPTKKSTITTISYNYYVWDENGVVTGNQSWEDNLMTLEGTTATLASTFEANLTKDTKYKYKIVQAVVGDGTEYAYLWLTSSTDAAGDGSYAWVYTPDKTRAYKVTYTYDTDQKTASASGSIAGAYYFVTSAVSGTWNVGDVLTESNGVYSGTIRNWAAKWFAIAPADALSDAGISDWTKVIRPSETNGGNVNFDVAFENYPDKPTTSSADGYVWYVASDNDANITITYDPTNGKWSATPYLEYEITNGCATFCPTQNVAIPTGVTAYYPTKIEKGSVTMSPIADGIPAGKGAYLVASNKIHRFEPASSTTAPDPEYLKDASGGVPASGPTCYNYVLAIQDEVVSFYKVTSNLDPQPGKAYLQTETDIQPGPGEARVAIIFSEDTGINGVEQMQQTDNRYYNLSGQRVAQPTKGLYIVNGKKVLVNK